MAAPSLVGVDPPFVAVWDMGMISGTEVGFTRSREGEERVWRWKSSSGDLGNYLPEGGNRFSFTKHFDEKTTVENLLKELSLPEAMPVLVVV